ncbi:MAG: cupin domain-containing protein [Candidatus Promineifilaceae bacterium]
MRIEHADSSQEKGWLFGPWNSNSELSIGYANKGIDEPHVHGTVTEIYLVGQGNAKVRVNDQTITIGAGDVLRVDPGEAHTFISNTEDYFHFVIHYPGLTGSEVVVDKKLVLRSDLGL